MTTKAYDLIETVRNGYEAQYIFPYHALVEIKFPHNEGVLHIPLPFFTENGRRIKFVLGLPISQKIRDDEFFHCPACGESSFYAGECDECFEKTEQYSRGERNHHALKKSIKVEFLYRLDAGMSIGKIKASIILADRDENEYWDIPYADEKIPKGQILYEAWRIIDEMISEGKIQPFERANPERPRETLYFRGLCDEFKLFKRELFTRLGYKFPIEYIVDTTKGSRCCRCGSIVPEKITIESSLSYNSRICYECARRDPVGLLKTFNVYETGIFNTTEDMVDPDTLENLTRYMEVPKNAYNRLFAGHAPAIIIKCENDVRYFVIPPNFLPEYKHVFEDDIEDIDFNEVDIEE